MSTMTRNTSDTSVSFSLAELARIEEERLREEDVQRARAREKEARAQREAEARRRAAEEARVAAEAEARAQREREEAAEKVRSEARERAALEVARIEAEAKARLEADNAIRAHELSIFRVRTEGSHRRLSRVLAAVLGLVLCGGGAAAYGAARHVASVEQDAAQLREGQLALAKERDHAKATELAALDRRHAALRARPLVREAGEARVTVEAARNAIDAASVDHGRLRAFGDALDVLQTRLEALERFTALDRRHAELDAWAAERQSVEVKAAAQSAAARAKTTGFDEGSLRAYEGALDQLRDAIAQSAGRKIRPPSSQPVVVKRPCAPGDPGCGLNGESVF